METYNKPNGYYESLGFNPLLSKITDFRAAFLAAMRTPEAFIINAQGETVTRSQGYAVARFEHKTLETLITRHQNAILTGRVDTFGYRRMDGREYFECVEIVETLSEALKIATAHCTPCIYVFEIGDYVNVNDLRTYAEISDARMRGQFDRINEARSN